MPTKGSPTHVKSSAKKKIGVLLGECDKDWTVQHSNYNTEDDNAALLLMTFSRGFYLLQASPQLKNMGRMSRSHWPPTTAHHLWATGDGCQGSTLPSEVTTVVSKYRLPSHKTTKEPNTTACILLCQRNVSYGNQLLSLATTEKTVEKQTCYRTETARTNLILVIKGECQRCLYFCSLLIKCSIKFTISEFPSH